jgi:hypothetical protein
LVGSRAQFGSRVVWPLADRQLLVCISEEADI